MDLRSICFCFLSSVSTFLSHTYTHTVICTAYGKYANLSLSPFITGILTGLLPFKNYTSNPSCALWLAPPESLHALNISTPQEGKVISKVLASHFSHE